jgi:hypothetical protein
MGAAIPVFADTRVALASPQALPTARGCRRNIVVSARGD